MRASRAFPRRGRYWPLMMVALVDNVSADVPADAIASTGPPEDGVAVDVSPQIQPGAYQASAVVLDQELMAMRLAVIEEKRSLHKRKMMLLENIGEKVLNMVDEEMQLLDDKLCVLEGESSVGNKWPGSLQDRARLRNLYLSSSKLYWGARNATALTLIATVSAYAAMLTVTLFKMFDWHRAQARVHEEELMTALRVKKLELEQAEAKGATGTQDVAVQPAAKTEGIIVPQAAAARSVTPATDATPYDAFLSKPAVQPNAFMAKAFQTSGA